MKARVDGSEGGGVGEYERWWDRVARSLSSGTNLTPRDRADVCALSAGLLAPLCCEEDRDGETMDALSDISDGLACTDALDSASPALARVELGVARGADDDDGPWMAEKGSDKESAGDAGGGGPCSVAFSGS